MSLGKSHERVASTLFNLGELYDSKQQFDQAISYYRNALSVYRDKYSTRLRQRLCVTFQGTTPTISGGSDDTDAAEVLSTGDQIVLHNTSFSTKEIQKQYSLVSEALRKATREDIVRRGGGIWYDSNEYWLRFEMLLFQFVDMLSTYVVDPTNAAMKNMITQSQQRIESAASHAIITAADALDYQFQLMLQE
jgi:tetratricopeptide (TPR) repeat protein